MSCRTVTQQTLETLGARVPKLRLVRDWFALKLLRLAALADCKGNDGILVFDEHIPSQSSMFVHTVMLFASDNQMGHAVC